MLDVVMIVQILAMGQKNVMSDRCRFRQMLVETNVGQKNVMSDRCRFGQMLVQTNVS